MKPLPEVMQLVTEVGPEARLADLGCIGKIRVGVTKQRYQHLATAWGPLGT